MAHDPTESSLNRLDSWKAIAAYLRRDVARWRSSLACVRTTHV